MLKLSSGQIARYGRGRFNPRTTASWWLARMLRTHAWNPGAVVGRLARLCELALHFRRHRKVVEVLSDPAFDGIRARQPQLTIKYLNPRHLIAGLSSSDRASAMVHHYNYLAKQVDDRTRRAILEEGLLIWTHDASPGQHAVWLRFSHPTDNEGELSIDYTFDGRLIYILSFSFVPGVLFDVPTETAILVSRIQGTRNLFAEIRSAMKSMHGLGAPALLMSSLQGVAEGLGLTHILGVTEARQVSKPMTGNDLKAVYDDFFEALGANGSRRPPSNQDPAEREADRRDQKQQPRPRPPPARVQENHHGMRSLALQLWRVLQGAFSSDYRLVDNKTLRSSLGFPGSVPVRTVGGALSASGTFASVGAMATRMKQRRLTRYLARFWRSRLQHIGQLDA